MEKTVSITGQGQLTIPKALRDVFGITKATKAVVRRRGNTIVVEPQRDFWSLSGSLASKRKLTDKQLKDARKTFAKRWPRV